MVLLGAYVVIGIVVALTTGREVGDVLVSRTISAVLGPAIGGWLITAIQEEKLRTSGRKGEAEK